MFPLVTAGGGRIKKCNTIKEDINIVLSFHSIFLTSSSLAEAARGETSRDASPRGFSHHQLAQIRVKPLLVLARLGALHDAFGLTSVSCLSLIGPVGVMEPRLTWVDCLGWQPNHLAPCQTPAGPKLRRHKQMGPQRTHHICTPTGR